MAVDLLAALKAGLAEGDLRAVRIFFDAAGLGTRKFDPDRLLAYAEKRGRSPYQIARLLISNRNPRDWDYLRKARSVAKLGWRRFGLKEEEAVDLVNEALASRWHAKHGLEQRFLVAFLRAPGAVPQALAELDASDFVNPCYAALFASWQEHGPASPESAAKFFEARGEVPALTPEWWESEARATLSEMLARRTRWTSANSGDPKSGLDATARL